MLFADPTHVRASSGFRLLGCQGSSWQLHFGGEAELENGNSRNEATAWRACFRPEAIEVGFGAILAKALVELRHSGCLDEAVDRMKAVGHAGTQSSVMS